MSESPQQRGSLRLKQMILDVEEALKTKTPAQVSAEFAEYQKDYPTVFETLLQKEYRRDILAMMVDQLDKIERGQVSQHNASVAVGTVIVDRIVKPQLRAGGSVPKKE
jgi:ABC-type phosphate transport system auxiliary subunit